MPLAVSWLDDTKFVASAMPPTKTCAPDTKFPPLIISVYEPRFVAAGVIPLSAGTGFSNVTVLEEVAALDAELVAVTVTLFGLGSEAGAVYTPAEVIVPAVDEPPGVPFTDQLTVVFELPLTAAENVSEEPARTFAVAGETTTAIAEPGTGFDFCVDDEDPPELHEARSTPASAGPITPSGDLWRKNRAAWNLASEARIIYKV